MTERWRSFQHATAGFSISLPGHLDLSTDVDGVALAAVEEVGDEQLAASVVVTVERVDTSQAWIERSRDRVVAALSHGYLLDEERLTDTGSDADARILVHYLHPAHGGTVLEQWLTLSGGYGYVVSCTAPALEYDELADAFNRVGESFRPTPPAAASAAGR